MKTYILRSVLNRKMRPYTSVKIFGFFILLVVLVVQFYFGSVALKQNPKKEGQEVLYRCQIRTSDDLTVKPVGCKKTKENRTNLFNTPTSWNDAGNNTNQVRSRKDRNKLYLTRTTDEFLKVPLQPDPLENVDIESCLDVFGNELLPLPECIHISAVTCGKTTEDIFVMMKSAIIVTRTCLVFHVFAESKVQQKIGNEMRYLSNGTKYEVTMYIYNITYPSKENQREWKDMFPQCTTQRLFIPDLLPKVDSVLYVDRDSLFISSPEKIWHFFSSFNSTQLAGLVAEHELPSIGWYNKQHIIPYYGKLGLNAGVILMNLTRMRNFRWSNRIIPLYWEYKSRLRLADQDLINLLFYFNPDKLFEISCKWNYRLDHCHAGNNCKNIETEGISLLHGSRKIFHVEGPFGAVHEAFRDFELETSTLKGLVKTMEEKLATVAISYPRGKACTNTLRNSIPSHMDTFA